MNLEGEVKMVTCVVVEAGNLATLAKKAVSRSRNLLEQGQVDLSLAIQYLRVVVQDDMLIT